MSPAHFTGKPTSLGQIWPNPSILKPRDITMLNLHYLHGVETKSNLTILYGKYESSVHTDEDRLQVTQASIGTSICILIHSHIKQGTITLWEDSERVMNSQFESTTNLTEAWQQIEVATYYIEMRSRALVNKLTCKIAAIHAKFANKSTLDQDKFIKRNLDQGLPHTYQSWLVDFVDSISLHYFFEVC